MLSVTVCCCMSLSVCHCLLLSDFLCLTLSVAVSLCRSILSVSICLCLSLSVITISSMFLVAGYAAMDTVCPRTSPLLFKEYIAVCISLCFCLSLSVSVCYILIAGWYLLRLVHSHKYCMSKIVSRDLLQHLVLKIK